MFALYVLAMTLPIKTTAEDVQTIVGYFKTKPAGATVSDARAVLGNTPLDGRKLKAYVAWEVLATDGDRYKLTDKGRRFGRDAAAEPLVLREILNAVGVYRASLEWAFHQKYQALTVDDVAANWHDHHHDALGTDNEQTIKGAVLCFFSLAGAAGLGRYVIGRGGATTRLELNREALEALVQDGPSAPPWNETEAEEEAAADVARARPDQAQAESSLTNAGDDETPPAPAALPTAVQEELRVFISHGKNMDIVDQVKTTLEIAGIQAEVAVEEESTAIPVPDKIFGAMRSCNAGIICVSAEAAADQDTLRLNENVLIEIGAAFVLYDKKVVLLWDKRIPVPSNLQGLYRCDYDGNELSWSTGMKLMKAIQGFKNAV